MNLIKFLFTHSKQTSANVAKKRLQIILFEQKIKNEYLLPTWYLPQLKKDLIQIICKYAYIDSQSVSIRLIKNKKNNPILEFSINLIKKP